jgi:hypothetical protein
MADSDSWVARTSADIRLHRDFDAGDCPGARVFYCRHLVDEAFRRAKGCRHLAVAVLWYLVGHFREQRKVQKSRVVAIAILLWGMILLCLSIVPMPEAFPWTFFRPDRF